MSKQVQGNVRQIASMCIFVINNESKNPDIPLSNLIYLKSALRRTPSLPPLCNSTNFRHLPLSWLPSRTLRVLSSAVASNHASLLLLEPAAVCQRLLDVVYLDLHLGLDSCSIVDNKLLPPMVPYREALDIWKGQEVGIQQVKRLIPQSRHDQSSGRISSESRNATMDKTASARTN